MRIVYRPIITDVATMAYRELPADEFIFLCTESVFKQ